MKKIVLALCLAASTMSMSAQYISPFFTSMPDDIVDYLSTANRQDLTDLYKAGKTAKVENLLKGQTELKEVEEDQLTLQMTEASTFQMKLLPLNDTAKIIAIIETACAPACDSRIRLFTTNWKSLNVNEILPKITLSDFLTTDKIDNEKVKLLDIPFYSYAFVKNSTDLTISLDTKNYLSKDDAKKIADLIKPSITLHWNKGQFSRE